jgi:predicted Zn-dependent protease
VRHNRKLSPELQKALRADIRKFHECMNERDYGAAKDAAAKAARGCASAGIQSAHAIWALAVANDCLGEVEVAFKLISEAAVMDPLDVNIEKSLSIIVARIRHILIDRNRDPADDSTPRLHALLVQGGMADELVHLAMARYLAAVGKAGEAMKFVEAVLLLSPTCRDAWVVKAELAKTLGLADEAVAAEAEASACDGGPVPLFGIAGKAVA